MALTCNQPECTLAQTGKCIFDRNPETCEDRLASLTEENNGSDTESSLSDPVLNAPTETARFKATYTLTLEQSEQLMRKRYCRVVGILGAPSAGKTACLVSLYLLLSRGRLHNYTFRDSLTLRALEEISQGARRWDETNSPEQLTLHTEIKDKRTAGFLHLRMCQTNTENIFDLLLPDLPGEWTSSLIDNNRSDRLSFLQSADTICIFISNNELTLAKRQYSLHRLSLLFDRLANLLDDRPNIKLVVTHIDSSTFDNTTFEKTLKTAKEFGFEVEIVPIASFSAPGSTVEPGTGISELVNQLLLSNNKVSTPPPFWPKGIEENAERQLFTYG